MTKHDYTHVPSIATIYPPAQTPHTLLDRQKLQLGMVQSGLQAIEFPASLKPIEQ